MSQLYKYQKKCEMIGWSQIEITMVHCAMQTRLQTIDIRKSPSECMANAMIESMFTDANTHAPNNNKLLEIYVTFLLFWKSDWITREKFLLDIFINWLRSVQFLFFSFSIACVAFSFHFFSIVIRLRSCVCCIVLEHRQQ